MMKNLKTKYHPKTKKTVLDKVKEVTSWIDSNPGVDADKYDMKKKELEESLNPIMMKLYGGGGSGMPMPQSMPEEAAPKVEEVD